jgi:antitoxin FitA
MPNVLVRDVEETVLQQLKRRAKENGRSLQNELQQMLRQFVEPDVLSDEETAAKIKESLRGRVFSDSAESLREDRQR